MNLRSARGRDVVGIEDRAIWDDLCGRFMAPVVQSFCWGEVKRALGHRVWRLRSESGIAGQFVEVRRGPARVAWCAGGPFAEGSPTLDQWVTALQGFSRSLRRPVVIAPHSPLPDGIDGNGSSIVKLHRPLYLPATAIVDLGGGFDEVVARLHPKWRNQLKQGQRCGVTAERITPSLTTLDAAATLVEKEAARAGFNSTVASSELRAMAEMDDCLLLHRGRIPGKEFDACWSVVFLAGTQALQLSLVTDVRARGTNVANVVVAASMRDLTERGIRRFDLGGYDTVRTPGVAHFKKRCGAEIRHYPGTYLCLPYGGAPARHTARLLRTVESPLTGRKDRGRPRIVWVGVEPTPYTLGFKQAVRDELNVNVDDYYVSQALSQDWGELTTSLEYRALRGTDHSVGLAGLVSSLLSNPPHRLVVEGWSATMAAAAAAARARKVPVFVSSDTWEPASEPGSARSRTRQIALPLFLRACAGLIGCGSPQRRHFLELGVPPEKIHVVPMTVNVTAIRDRIAAHQTTRDAKRQQRDFDGYLVALFVGRLVPYKRVDTLLDALRMVQGQFRGVVVGDGPQRAALEASAPPGTVFTGRLEGDDLWSELAAADVFVLPTDGEPWGLVVNEAMAADLPVVVSSRVGAAEDLVDDTWTFPPGDFEALAVRLRLLVDEVERKAVIAGQRERLEAYTFPRAAQAFASTLGLGA